MAKLLIPLLLVIAVIAVIACLAIYNRKRQRPTQLSVAEEAQPTVVEEAQPTEVTAIEEVQPAVAEEPQPIAAEKPEPTSAEAVQPTPVEEAQAEEPQPIAEVELQPTVAEEPQPIAAEEPEPAPAEAVQPTPVEEAQAEEPQPTAEVELQPTVAEETQPTGVEETQHIAPEETKPTIAEETQQQIAKGVPTRAVGVWRRPEERRGRPRGRALSPEEKPKEKRKKPHQNPEVVCWKRERQWIVGIEVPEDLLLNPGLEVLQSGQPLTQDELREGCWLLYEAHAPVVIRWSGDRGTKETKIALDKESYLLFKMIGKDQNQGRRVKSPSSGSYLVMVPDDWERDDRLSGPPPVAPESVSLTGYKAHFFELEKDSDGKIAFHTYTGESFVIETKARRYELIGNPLNDATERIGPLFGEKPPQIHALGSDAWRDVKTIVIGEEGTGKGKWRLAFSPVQDLIDQDLPSEVAARKSGWYFLRFYDQNDDLIESLDFRFITVLKEIKISQPPPLPSEDGHRPVSVEFLHEPDCVVQSANGHTSIRIERQDDKTTLTIPPDPAFDETRWLVGPEDGPKVQVTILVERIWWAVGEEDKEPSEWKDQPLTIPREDFAATSKRALWLRFPRKRWVDEVFVGFDKAKARHYKVTKRTIAVPLREFGDGLEVIGSEPVNLKLWVHTYVGVLCKLELKFQCKFCSDFTSADKEDFIDHALSFHRDDIYQQLTYKEPRNHIPSLPSEIYLYQCPYCGYYVRSDDPRNPTSTICNHIERDCPKVPRRTEIRFRIVSDPDEIRRNVIHNQRIYRCRLCNRELEDPDESDMRAHLKDHRDELYKKIH